MAGGDTRGPFTAAPAVGTSPSGVVVSLPDDRLPLITIPGFPTGVRALMSWRGAEQTAWGYNLATHTGEPPEAVLERRATLAYAIKARPHWLEQVHGRRVVELRDDAHLAPDPGPAQADASVSRSWGEASAVLVADCLPVLMALTSGAAVAAAHAGWRGLQAGVLQATLDRLTANAPASDEVVAWLGPCIGAQAFEVGPEVREAFCGPQAAYAKSFRPSPGRTGHWIADLQGLAMVTMLDWASRHHRVLRWAAPPGGCTVHEATQWFSYRREGRTGRMAALIWRENPALARVSEELN